MSNIDRLVEMVERLGFTSLPDDRGVRIINDLNFRWVRLNGYQRHELLIQEIVKEADIHVGHKCKKADDNRFEYHQRTGMHAYPGRHDPNNGNWIPGIIYTRKGKIRFDMRID